MPETDLNEESPVETEQNVIVLKKTSENHFNKTKTLIQETEELMLESPQLIEPSLVKRNDGARAKTGIQRGRRVVMSSQNPLRDAFGSPLVRPPTMVNMSGAFRQAISPTLAVRTSNYTGDLNTIDADH